MARQFEAATARYVGLHLVALSVGDWELAQERLARRRFRPNDPVHLTRPIEEENGNFGEARFTVLRVPPEAMPEGRIQLLEHHTPDVVWQQRFLDHPNGIVSLKGVLIAVSDPEETAARFGRFAGRTAIRRTGYRWVLKLDRGVCAFVQHNALPQLTPLLTAPAAAPRIAGYALGSTDPALTRDHFAAGGLDGKSADPKETVYRLPPELGGLATVVPTGAAVSWAT